MVPVDDMEDAEEESSSCSSSGRGGGGGGSGSGGRLVSFAFANDLARSLMSSVHGDKQASNFGTVI